jgi:glucokinase
VERVCSGIGVPNIYEFLRDEENSLERSEIAQLIESTITPIVEAAFDPQHPSELCLATVDLLVSILASEAGKILASEAGNLALKVVATGGVYLAGGIALHLVKLLPKPQFVQTFTRKGPLQRLNGADADSHHHHTCGSSRSCHIRTAEAE